MSHKTFAIWSGPRNISTAMMRSFGNRDDTFVTDEPLYAHYLLEHGHDHPGRDEILEHHESDAQAVVDWLTGPIPQGRTVWYQKHMAHHLIDDVPRDWLDQVDHAFLIREPREMLTSLMQIVPEPGIEDTGLPQQLEIFERLARRGATPPIVDSRDLLEDPRRGLGRMCSALGIDFQEAMLSWPAGRRETDGVWAPHWYGAVERSTGFHPYRPKDVDVPEQLLPVLDEAERYYAELRPRRLR